ncbi:hypothetical protein ECSTEC7V_1844 [Escherichia coli STEC_7v]|nr:hypothetical protein ECSTEC7V_1844 [Escherichia coli STEC_7v]
MAGFFISEKFIHKEWMSHHSLCQWYGRLLTGLSAKVQDLTMHDG